MSNGGEAQTRVATWQVQQDTLIRKLQEENASLNARLSQMEERMETFVRTYTEQKVCELTEMFDIKWSTKATSISASVQQSLEVCFTGWNKFAGIRFHL